MATDDGDDADGDDDDDHGHDDDDQCDPSSGLFVEIAPPYSS